jgi:IS30 family transposase
LTINDRATGILFMTKVKSKNSFDIENATISLLKDWMPLIYTITSDNGKEFAQHKSISEKLNLDFFFAKPYCSWERGSNENLNGLVRQYFPKGGDFTNLKMQDVALAQNILNNRPRKRFGYKSPNEMLALKIDQASSVAFMN